MGNDTLTAIDGILVGHAVLEHAPSGCTVVIPAGQGATAGVDIRGGAPGTFGTDTLNPLNLVDKVHGLFFTGGSAFGLSVAEGLRVFLSDRGVGFDSGYGLIPIVAGAVIFDLALNPSRLHPDADLGYKACLAASSEPVVEGCAGAGLGATVGKLYGLERAMKGGVGSACIESSGGVRVAALMVVNAFGDIVDPCENRILAGCRESARGRGLIDADSEITRLLRLRGFPDGQNTIVGVVATNAKFNKTQLTKIAQMAHDGLARTVYPAHTLFDGDTIFALSCGEEEGIDVSAAGSMAARATAQAILRAVRKAHSIDELPSSSDLPGYPQARLI